MTPTNTLLLTAASAALLLGGFGCAAGTDELAERVDATDNALRDEVQSLHRELDAVYDRERAMAERLRRAEEDLAIVQARVEDAGERIDSLDRRTVQQSVPPAAPTSPAPPKRVAPSNVVDAYEAASKLHRDHDYAAAMAAFRRILDTAPAHSLADNAQSWIGKGSFGLGRYREALAAFTKVLSYETTEKDDDAQLMIARSYMALGERDAAIDALQAFLIQYPASEYIAIVQRELDKAESE